MNKVARYYLNMVFVVAALVLGANAQAFESEFTAHVAAIDVENRKVTLNARSIRNEDYRLAFDVSVRLLNGDVGSIANIRVGNYVTAVANLNEKVIHAIHVVKE